MSQKLYFFVLFDIIFEADFVTDIDALRVDVNLRVADNSVTDKVLVCKFRNASLTSHNFFLSSFISLLLKVKFDSLKLNNFSI